MPAWAATWAMPCPICPAPTTPSLATSPIDPTGLRPAPRAEPAGSPPPRFASLIDPTGLRPAPRAEPVGSPPPRFASLIGPVAVDLGALELSCERTATTLVPCYADLVAAMRDRGADFHGELTRVFADLIADIFVDRRLEERGFPAALVIRAAAPSVVAAPQNASLHLDLDAELVPAP